MSRYARQSLFREIGPEGQEKIGQSQIAIVGIGALGCQEAAILARAGVGHLRLIDRDLVDLTNLQRQILFTEKDAYLAAPKASTARDHLSLANSQIEIVAHDVDLDARNIARLLGDVDVIVDGSDNFEVRYLVNDFAISRRIPWIYAAAVGATGLLMPVLPGETSCLRCIFEEPPPAGAAQTCDTAGVLGSTTATVGALAAAEALKIAAGRTDAVRRGLLQLDLWANEERGVEISTPRAECPCCGAREFPFLDARTSGATTSFCGRDAIQVRPADPARGFAWDDVRRRIMDSVVAEDRGLLLRFHDDDLEVTLFRDGRAIVRGTVDPARARAVYARFVGA